MKPFDNNDKIGSYVLTYNNEKQVFLKKQIMPTPTSEWIEQNAIEIVVPFDSLPVTVNWDKTVFNTPERDFSLITDWTFGGWFDAGNCSFKEYLRDTQSIQIKDVDDIVRL